MGLIGLISLIRSAHKKASRNLDSPKLCFNDKVLKVFNDYSKLCNSRE